MDKLSLDQGLYSQSLFEGSYDDNDPVVVALLLRKAATDLLVEAVALDGLSPCVIVHTSDFGVTARIGWFNGEPSIEQAEGLLDSKFEPNKGEMLDICGGLLVSQLMGTEITDVTHSVNREDEDDSGPGMSPG